MDAFIVAIVKRVAFLVSKQARMLGIVVKVVMYCVIDHQAYYWISTVVVGLCRRHFSKFGSVSVRFLTNCGFGSVF